MCYFCHDINLSEVSTVTAKMTLQVTQAMLCHRSCGSTESTVTMAVLHQFKIHGDILAKNHNFYTLAQTICIW